jgi:hypothetical protein
MTTPEWRRAPHATDYQRLVDELAYEDQVDQKVAGSGRERRIDGDDYARVRTGSVGLGRGPRVGVIYAAGTINSGKSRYDPINGTIVGADTLIDYIRDWFAERERQEA